MSTNTSVGRAIDQIKQALRSGVGRNGVTDVAFIGNTSGVYPWVPCQMVDLDSFLFAEALDGALGGWLTQVRDRLAAALDDEGVDFELRIVEGPYKPSRSALDRPVIVAHLGVFTEALYSRSAPLKRWAWRKYRCEVEPGRLARLAPERPTPTAFRDGARGLRERLAAIRAGSVAMTEWLLPSLETRVFALGIDDVAFQECCFAYAANCARNHARALGHAEPDALGNADFFRWYEAEVFASEPLTTLMALKAACRDTGFNQDTGRVRALALGYMQPLLDHLDAL